MAQPTDWTAVGERVREARQARQLTQGELGSAAGLPGNRVTRLEGGEAVGEEKLAAVARVLGVSLPWLRYGVAEAIDAERARELGYQLGRSEVIARVAQLIADLTAHAAPGRQTTPYIIPPEESAVPAVRPPETGAARTRRPKAG